MSSPAVEAIIGRVRELGAPDGLVEQMRPALEHVDAHGDREALPAIAAQVEAVALALAAGDIPVALELAGEWAVLAGPVLGLAGD